MEETINNSANLHANTDIKESNINTETVKESKSASNSNEGKSLSFQEIMELVEQGKPVKS